jgi:hypothetical protein
MVAGIVEAGHRDAGPTREVLHTLALPGGGYIAENHYPRQADLGRAASNWGVAKEYLATEDQLAVPVRDVPDTI